MEKKQEIETKMESWRNEYIKKDNLCKAFLKKKTCRRKKRESKCSSEIFEIVIENAETSEVKSFHANKQNININANTDIGTKNLHLEGDLSSQNLMSENQVVDKNVGTNRYDEELARSARNASVDDVDNSKRTGTNGLCLITSAVDKYFDKNGNEIMIKTESNEPVQQNNTQNVFHSEVKENTNQPSQTNVDDYEQSESVLWYIATGYDIDIPKDKVKHELVQSMQTEEINQPEEDHVFDISNIKIEHESDQSVDGLDIFDNENFVDTNYCTGTDLDSESGGLHVGSSSTVNKISKLEMVDVSDDTEIKPKNKINTIESKVEPPYGRHDSVKKSTCLKTGNVFPNLTFAIKNNVDSNKTEKHLSLTSRGICNVSSISDHMLCNKSENTEPVKGNVKTTDRSTNGNKQYCSWQKLQECPDKSNNDIKTPTKVKFTLKKQHVVKKFNALKREDKCLSKDISNNTLENASIAEGPSIVQHEGDNEKSLKYPSQLSTSHRCVNKQPEIVKASNSSDPAVVDKTSSWLSVFHNFSAKKNKGKSVSSDNIGNEHSFTEEAENSFQSELDKPEDVDYNYVMLDGIMSLTLTGKDELEKTTHLDKCTVETNMDLPAADPCVGTHDMRDSNTVAANDSTSQIDVIDSYKTRSEVGIKTDQSIKQELAIEDNFNIESFRNITLADDVFKTENLKIKIEKNEEVTNNDDKVFQMNSNCASSEAACNIYGQGEISPSVSEIESENEKMSLFKNFEENSFKDEEENFGFGLKLPLSLPDSVEDVSNLSNENSTFETIQPYDNDMFYVSDNSTSFSVDSDNEDEESKPEICESYKIIQRYVFDRCTGNNLQKILVRVKERKTYTDHELDDDEIEGKRSYKIEDKLRSDKYSKDYVKRLAGEDFTLRYLQENGLQYPILFSEKTGLGLRVPSDNFKVCDVKACVGSRRMLDVMDVNTQKGLEMTMKEWTKYYETIERDRLLNVISLEFSHTKLENYVESPNLVREIDWVDSAWPQHLKDCQTESTNAIDKMKYPKVQKYCLMSVAGCYTDFHIDFGGTSVWYHILHGEKIFWLIPPTDKNLAKYENWVLSGKQGDAFLADSIEECQMIQLVAGNTFIIPSGWIHAVYTPKDSLVFGGNFLHSFNMVNQLKVSAIEDKTHVPMKFRYPFYAEINWYVLERYVHSLTGVTYLEKPQLNEDLEVINTKIDQANFELLEEKLNKRLSVSLTRIDDTSPGRKSTSDDDSTASGPTRSPGQASTLPRTGRKSSSESANSLDLKSVDKPEIMKVPYKSPVKKRTKYIHLTKYELEGLIEVLGWVESLPPTKKGIPKDLIDPDAVLREVKRLIQEHMKDNPELAITGEPVLEWTKATKKLIKLKQKAKTAKLLGTHCAPKVKTGGKNASGNRHRRVRCKKCEPCTRDDCMECNFCKDMRKYGGPGRAKQSCISRQCLAPILPKGIVCLICKMPVCLLDKPVKTDGAVDDDAEDYSSALMECGICWEIVHPLCLRKKNENLNNDGILNEDLPNSWKCSKCCFDGKEGKLMARVFKGGWRPTPASTPPPLSVSPPLQPNSPTGIQEVIVTEGKRVTLNQGIDSKKTMPKLSLSPEHREIYSKPFNGSGSEDLDDIDTPKLKMEVSGDEKVNVKMEVIDEPQSISNEPTAGIFKSNVKRSSSPSGENPLKKKRNISPSPNRPSKSSKVHGPPKASLSSGRKPGKSTATDLNNKRSKRETTPRSGTRCTYDFDDDEECMDISAPLPDKGKGKGIKGRKSLHLKNKDFGASLGSNVNSKSRTQTLEPKPEDRGHLTKYSSEKLCSEQLRQTLISHIERRNLPVIKPQFVVRPAPISPPDDYCVMNNGQKHPLSRKVWTFIFHYLSSADLARCQAVCQIWNRWCINPDLWKKIDLSKKRIVQTHLMGIVRRQPEYLDLSSVIMTQKQILWLLERIPLLKTLIVSKCSWATISGLCMSACPLLYKLDVSWATGLNDRCFEDLISPPVDRKPAVKNISRLHRLRSIHLSGTEITDTSLELMTLHLSHLEELNISYCTRITDRGIQILASSKSPTQDSLKVLNICGCRGLTEVSLDAIKNFSKLKELYATNCIRIPTERCRSLRHPRLKIFRY